MPRRARRDAGVLWGIGAHVIKTGLGPVLIDLMERGFVSALAINGAGVIHDFELALSGATSEEVDEALGPGRFGMADETGASAERRHQRWRRARARLGQAVGRVARTRAAAVHVPACSPPRRGSRSRSPCTSRSAPTSSTCIRRRQARRSARAACATSATWSRTSRGSSGGVYLNCGSAVILPEVFLKAVALARNAGISLDGLTTVNMDFIRHYRPQTNVVSRPVAGIGRGYSLVGHHEI